MKKTKYWPQSYLCVKQHSHQKSKKHHGCDNWKKSSRKKRKWIVLFLSIIIIYMSNHKNRENIWLHYVTLTNAIMIINERHTYFPSLLSTKVPVTQQLCTIEHNGDMWTLNSFHHQFSNEKQKLLIRRY